MIKLAPLVSALCEKLPTVRAIYSFGSVAAGTDGPESDEDGYMSNDIVSNKAASVERSIKRIREEYL